jgi:hypothetical protein
MTDTYTYSSTPNHDGNLIALETNAMQSGAPAAKSSLKLEKQPPSQVLMQLRTDDDCLRDDCLHTEKDGKVATKREGFVY